MQLMDVDGGSFEAEVMDVRDELVVVDFWGPRCPNCEVFKADAPALLAQLDGARCRVVRVNAYEEPALARRFGLFGVPTFVLIRDGEVLGKMSQYRGAEFWLAVVRERLPAE